MTFIAIGIVVLLLIYSVSVYNGLINKKSSVEEAQGSIDVMLKKRHDLIPNLVAAVKQYMSHESNVLQEITALRSQLTNTSQLPEQERFNLENKLSSSLRGLMVSVENYPDLKANQNFLHLQRSLNEVEEQLSAARRFYNAAVKSYNNGVEMFPSNIIAGMMSFGKRPFFEATSTERATPNISSMFS